MKHAISLLRSQVETSEHNAGIAGNEGRLEDEKLCLAVAEDCRKALALLDPEELTTGQSEQLGNCKQISTKLAEIFFDDPLLLEREPRGLRVHTALGAILNADTRHAMLAAIGKVHKTLGAPGNYGYDTPAGDTLMALYRAHDALAAN